MRYLLAIAVIVPILAGEPALPAQSLAEDSGT